MADYWWCADSVCLRNAAPVPPKDRITLGNRRRRCRPKMVGMKAVKEVIRAASQLVGGIAALVFLRASLFTENGWLLTGASLIVAIVCVAGYTWSEPDEDPPSDKE